MAQIILDLEDYTNIIERLTNCEERLEELYTIEESQGEEETEKLNEEELENSKTSVVL